MLSFGLFKILAIRQAKVLEALPMRQLIYVSNDAFDAILEPNYTKPFTFSISFSINYNFAILIDGGISVPWLRTLVF